MLRRIVIAAITAVVLFYTVFFIQLGTIWFFELEAMKELVMMFFFLIATFWVHEKVALFFNSNRLAAYPSIVKAILEGVAVVTIGAIFCVVFVFIPQYLFIPTVEFTPSGIRLTLMVTAILSLFFYYFVERESGRKKLQDELIKAEQLQKENFKAQLESLKSQVNPHFLFNSLNILSSLIYKDQDLAVQFLGQLAEVYRAVLDSSGKSLVPLRKELELASAYIYLMKTRFGNNLKFEVGVPDDKLHYALPPTSVQMLIENAIKHNAATAQKPLIINIYLEDNMLVVANNLQPRIQKESSTKIGLQNVVNRYRHLTEQEVEIKPSEQKFIVKLPLIKPDAA